MAFAARWDSRSKYLNDIDELIIPFHGTTDKLTDFLDAHIDQRVIVDIQEPWRSFFGAIFAPIGEKYTNIALRLSEVNMDIIPDIKKTKIPYFTTEVVVEWEKFQELVSYGVSDIYIGEQLGFELDDVGRASARAGIRTRIFPNVAQSARTNTDPLKKFFLRPEDVDLYNRRYISTFEFYIPIGIDLNWDVLYRAYAINKKWTGRLDEIIIGLDSDIDSTFISPYWASARMTCHRKCLKYSDCNICGQLYNLSKSLAAIRVMPKPPVDTKAAAKETMKTIDRKTIDAEEPLDPPIVPNF